MKYINTHSRLSWLMQETDSESGLRGHGVRKYDRTNGRFVSIDPLWESQLSWSPYHYCYNNPINLLDLDGKKPGDPFKSSAQAAHDFGKNYNPLSFALNAEISTTIYKYSNSDGGTNYTYAIPNAINVNASNPNYSTINIDGYEKVTDVHTHGPFHENKFDQENFSVRDKDYSKKNRTNIFLINFKGQLKIFDFINGSTTIITNDLPKDPGSSKKAWQMVDDNTDQRPLPLIINNGRYMELINNAKTDLQR